MHRLTGVAVLAALGGLWLAVPALSWAAVKARIRKEFPTVRAMTTSELAAALGTPAEPKPLLLDVRTAAEFEVSHLANARQVDPDAAATEVRVAKDTPIVTYCSVGYRSAVFSQRLQAAGFTNVRNLEGSIFQWANEGRPLTAPRVHPYNKKWGALLNAPLRADVPAVK
jgi:rhodanese-related sulfurtransferase